MRERQAPRLVRPPVGARPSLDVAELLKILEPLAGAFADMVGDRLAERISATPSVQRPQVIDRRALAAHLGVCVDTVDKLRSQGMPELKVGDSPRYELDRVLEWLRGRS